VSCIYGIGSREDYEAMVIPLRVGQELTREQLLSRLVDLQYSRNDIAFERGKFRVRGDTVELCPAYTEDALRIEFFGDTIDRVTRFEPLTGKKLEELATVAVYPAAQFVTSMDKIKRAILTIRAELGEREQAVAALLAPIREALDRTTFQRRYLRSVGDVGVAGAVTLDVRTAAVWFWKSSTGIHSAESSDSSCMEVSRVTRTLVVLASTP